MSPARIPAAEVPPPTAVNWLCAGLVVNLSFLIVTIVNRSGMRSVHAVGGVYLFLLLLGVWRARPQRRHEGLWRLWFLMIVGQLAVYNLTAIMSVLDSSGVVGGLARLFAFLGLVCGWMPALMVYSVSVRGRMLLVAEVAGPLMVILVPLMLWHLGWR